MTQVTAVIADDELPQPEIHRSCIVRVSAIHAVERDGDGRLSLSLRGRADRLPVSSAFQHRFKGM
jgi:DNA-binding LytR/AlgR family response regulator